MLFDFGLNTAQEDRARRLQDDSIIIDMLFQGPAGPGIFSEEMSERVKADYEDHHDVARTMAFARGLPARMAIEGQLPAFREWWDASGITAANQGIGADSLADSARSLGRLTHMFDSFEWLVKARTAEDIRRAKAEGKRALFLGAQNTLVIGQDLDNLDMLYEFGLRVLQLTYNRMNFVAAGCTERTDAGVSSFGQKLIERMNELGIIVDTGHCGHRTTSDACEISRSPVIASHTAAKAVHDHVRGKTDEEFVALAKTGGVIGVAALPAFISARPDGEATISAFLDHIDYIAKLVGTEHVGIGTDWPLSMPWWCWKLYVEKLRPSFGWRPDDRTSLDALVGFKDYREFINITRGLVSRGYSDAEVAAILGGNWLRVIEQVWKG